ncbi:hypothetical protein CYMTET_32207 [Cymbomonas tetramitiformis]|uniref:Uncharacterized protein n=1 Tax=Cymbomonas tetramitiformis TaxID=36881 RepID=A0AAE0KS37_9CHLO|nr:hypothetical protein CYMTET_32207 [Cymbomonas tetramitiformis]
MGTMTMTGEGRDQFFRWFSAPWEIIIVHPRFELNANAEAQRQGAWAEASEDGADDPTGDREPDLVIGSLSGTKPAEQPDEAGGVHPRDEANAGKGGQAAKESEPSMAYHWALLCKSEVAGDLVARRDQEGRLAVLCAEEKKEHGVEEGRGFEAQQMMSCRRRGHKTQTERAGSTITMSNVLDCTFTAALGGSKHTPRS